jgi:peptidyl-prolyl cis-trans isomerase A (cyclophilin A)
LTCLFSAPDEFRVLFNTTKGVALVKVVREWSPFGVDRFYDLVKHSYYNHNGIFRVIQTPRPFVAQWGINGHPAISSHWNTEIPNDPVVKSNTRGFITYAADMDSNNKACCRTTQIYVNYADNSRLDASGFAPFAFVEKGMEVLDRLYSGYGEGVDQGALYKEGNAYLKRQFPLLDYMTSMTLVP